jgi:hypothetical protein
MQEYLMPLGGAATMSAVNTYMAAHKRDFSILNDHGVKYLQSTDLEKMTAASKQFGIDFAPRVRAPKA